MKDTAIKAEEIERVEEIMQLLSAVERLLYDGEKIRIQFYEQGCLEPLEKWLLGK